MSAVLRPPRARPRPGALALAVTLAAALAVALAALAPAVAGAARAAHAARSAAQAGAATGAAEPAGDPWHEARRLADAGDFDAALAVLRPAIQAHQDEFELRWLEAGITGEAGRHAQSVTLYQRLAADFPARAAELRGDLAAERLEADDPHGAARDYRAWLAAHPDDGAARRGLALALARSDSLAPALAAYDSLTRAEPADVELALDRARVLSWMDRHDDAIAAYRAILARDSANASARLGVAMNQNWQGLHRRAARTLDSLASRPDADPEAGKALAFARYWDDDPDGAMRALDGYLGREPGDREGRDLALRIARERRPQVTVGFGRADDSDELRILSGTVDLSWPLWTGATGLAGWRRDRLEDPGGTRDPRRYSGGLRQRWNPTWTTYGTYTYTDWGDSAGLHDGGEAGVVFRPADRVRIEAALAREPVMTRRSLEFGITALTWVGAIDFSPTERLSLHADGREGSYSDQNRLERVGLSAKLRTWSTRHAEVSPGVTVEQLKARLQVDHGYYDPELHREWGPTLDAEWRPRDTWTFGLSSQAGWQGDRGGDNTPFYGYTGRAEVRVAEVWTLALEGGRSDSSLQSDSGYQRAWWQAAVSRGF